MTGSFPVVEWDSSYGTHGWDGQPKAVQLRLEELSIGEVQDAHRTVSLALLPADDVTAIKYLAKLRASTASRQAASGDVDMVMETYAETFRDYPADVVVEVMTLAPKLFKFWPTVSELVELMERRTRRRRLVLKAIEQELARRAA